MKVPDVPRTKREILTTLHIRAPERNFFLNLFSEENNRGGFGIRHILLIVITFTFTVIALSVIKGRSTVQISAVNNDFGIPLVESYIHYVYLKSGNYLIIAPRIEYINKETFDASISVVSSIVNKKNIGVIIVLCNHTGIISSFVNKKKLFKKDVILFFSAFLNSSSYIDHPNVFSGDHFFSLVNKNTNFDVMTIPPEVIAVNPVNPLIKRLMLRLQRKKISNILIATKSPIDASRYTIISKVFRVHPTMSGGIEFIPPSSDKDPVSLKCEAGLFFNSSSLTYECT